MVVAAIDERILNQAIINKYQGIGLTKKEASTSSKALFIEELSREYMDKLFITGIKLGELTTSDKENVLDALHKGIVNPSSYRNRNEAAPSKDPVNTDQPEKRQLSDSPPVSTHSSPRVIENIEDDFQLEIEEHNFLKELAIERDMTPRSIRVFSTRYRLGKQIIQTLVKSSPLLEEEWNDVSLGNRFGFAKMLIEKTYGEDSAPLVSPINEILESVAEMVTPYA